MKTKLDLSTLPLHFQKFNKYFYKNTKDSSLVHVDNLHKHIKKQETEVKEYWWNKL